MMSFGDRILLATTVTDVHEGQYMYQACKVCYSKVAEPFSNPQRSICTKCNSSYNCEDTYYRFCLRITAADSSCLANITVFGNILNQFFGAQGSEFYYRHVLRLKQKYRHLGDVILKTAIENLFVGQNLIFGFKVPKSFYSTKSKNQEILLKDICKVTIPSFQKNCENSLPELTAVQLLPHPNSIVTFTVIDVLEILERRLEEMGYLDIGKITSELIKTLSRQISAPQGLHVAPSQDQQSCNLTSSIALPNSQTSLRLSCDSSLDISLNSTSLELPGKGNNSTMSPATLISDLKCKNKLKMSTDNNSLLNNDIKYAADKGDLTHSMHHTPSKNITSFKRSSVKEKVKKSLQKQTPKTESSGCKTQTKSSAKSSLLNKENINDSATEGSQVSKYSKKGNTSGLSLSSRISHKSSEFTWSVYKYNQEKLGKARRSKLGNVTLCPVEPVKVKQLSLKSKQKQLSSTVDTVCEISEVNVSLDTVRTVSKEDNGSQIWLTQDSGLKGPGDLIERSMQGDGVGIPVEDQIFEPTFTSIDLQTNVFHVNNNYMPESEDLELFLAAVNAEATCNTGSQGLEETKGGISLSSRCVNETIEEHPHELIVRPIENIDKQSYNEIPIPNETSREEVSQHQNFTITDEYAAAISFNVTIRRSQKRQSRYNFSKSLTKTDNISTAELSESEDLWQFLERFPSTSTDSMYSFIDHNKPCQSVNNSRSTDHNLGLADKCKEKILPLTRTVRLEDRHLKDLINKPRVGTCKSNFPLISDCSQLNSQIIEAEKADSELLQAEHPVSHSNNDSQEDLVLGGQFSLCSETLITSTDSITETLQEIKDNVNQDKHLTSLSADTDTLCSSVIDSTLFSSSVDLFHSSHDSFMSTPSNNNANNDSPEDFLLDSQFSQVSEALIPDTDNTDSITDTLQKIRENADQDKHLFSLSANTDTLCSSTIDDALFSSSQDLFNSSNNSFMSTSSNNNGSLLRNKCALKHHSHSTIENETAAIENFPPAKDKLSFKKNPDKECPKKVRFSVVTKKHFYWEFDLIKDYSAPREQSTLKSCLKLPTLPQDNHNIEFSTTTSQVYSEDLFLNESDCEFISNNSLSSPSLYNNSVELFSPSPIVQKPVRATDTHNQTILTTNYVNSPVVSLDYSMELFSQSRDCNTPVFMNNQVTKIAEVPNCLSPDLFD